MQFKDIPSNNITKQHLLKSIQNNRLSHAYMFLGGDGSSNLAMAWAFAQYIRATSSKTDYVPCPSCLKCNKLNCRFSLGISSYFWQYKTLLVTTIYECDLLENNNYPTEEDWYLKGKTINKALLVL